MLDLKSLLDDRFILDSVVLIGLRMINERAFIEPSVDNYILVSKVSIIPFFAAKYHSKMLYRGDDIFVYQMKPLSLFYRDEHLWFYLHGELSSIKPIEALKTSAGSKDIIGSKYAGVLSAIASRKKELDGIDETYVLAKSFYLLEDKGLDEYAYDDIYTSFSSYMRKVTS